MIYYSMHIEKVFDEAFKRLSSVHDDKMKTDRVPKFRSEHARWVSLRSFVDMLIIVLAAFLTVKDYDIIAVIYNYYCIVLQYI